MIGGLNGILTAIVVASASAALLALGGGRVYELDVLSHLAPAYVTVGAVGALWAFIVGRGPLFGASALAFAAGCFLMAPEFSRDSGPIAPAGAPGAIKVIQINALRSNADVHKVADWLIGQKPDVVMVTEARHDLRDELVSRANWRTAGAQGNLMIFTPRRYIRMDRPRVAPGQLFTFVNATYAGPHGQMELVTAHLGWPIQSGVRAQARGLVSVVSSLPRHRMILAGDFNATPWSAEMQRLDEDLGLIRRDRFVPTWPAQVLGRRWPLPFLPIDHVYAGPGWATVKVERGPWLGSDHYPLIVTLAPVAQRAPKSAARP